MLYQWAVAGGDLEASIATYLARHAPAELVEDAALARFAADLVRRTVEHRADLDARIRASVEHWRLERLALVDRLILQLATLELVYHQEIPRAVVIDEAVELAKTFGGEDSARFVNGVLDAIRTTGDTEAGEGKEEPVS